MAKLAPAKVRRIIQQKELGRSTKEITVEMKVPTGETQYVGEPGPVLFVEASITLTVPVQLLGTDPVLPAAGRSASGASGPHSSRMVCSSDWIFQVSRNKMQLFER